MDINNNILLFFSLLAAVAAGWGIARMSGVPRSDKRRNLFRSEYFKGLNFLLNEQPDKAIEVFVKMVAVDSQTVETHFALGSLFRRRGEVDRAIRIHQNLIARPNLSRANRYQALYELGVDYMRAGLLDRAESLFLDLLSQRELMEEALAQLISIYEQQKDWEQAISMCRRLENVTGRSHHREIAQYNCELAQIALDNRDRRRAQRLLTRAQSMDRECARAGIMLGEMAADDGDFKLAVRNYRNALDQDVGLAPEILSPLARCYERLGDRNGLGNIVHSVVQNHPEGRNYIALAAIADPSIKDPVVEACVDAYIKDSKALHGLYDILRVFSGELDRPLSELPTRSVRLALRRVMESSPRYLCQQCGYTGKTLYWHCPSCKSWNSIRPYHDISLTPAYGSEAGVRAAPAGKRV